ncbi:MAG: SDR family NAD(P)-dependent oxidoreductase [Solirubrobacterales bacterium]
MSCRLPGGVESAAELWGLLDIGADGIGPFPGDRGWNLDELCGGDKGEAPKSLAVEGGFVTNMAEFDCSFFRVSPRDAQLLDPQQRQVLEATWEALEHAAIDPASLRGGDAGVYIGVMRHDYAGGRGGYVGREGQLTTGLAGSVVSGRVAYALGLEGPAISVDTACSSSLVAIHQAVGALRGGECTLALAGGVTVLSTADPFVEFSRQRGLAPDGRCKSFAEAADGVGFSEGVGVLVLERLSDARRNGHEVLATIRGSAINQDGASNGLTAPNGPSQQKVIMQALANAGLGPADVDAVEAHGTGTTLGDPIEAGALLATYGQERGERGPLLLGSVKSNIGHAQAAAGVAGVIKMVEALRHEELPRTLHVDEPSSHVDWGSGEVELLTEARPWPRQEGLPRRAGVSSFGISGTNAHVILEEAPVVEGEPETVDVPEPPLRAPVALPFSAKAEPALAEMASDLAAHLREHPDLDPADVSLSLATTRSRHEHRAVAVGEGRDELLAGLDGLGRGESRAGTVVGRARDGRPVFVFPGQGAQAAGMARGLLDASPVFAEQISACEEALAPHVDWSLVEILRDDDEGWLERLDVVQPALFAVMVSLARLWEACGVEPAAVVGHSQGEIAAAHIAGALSLDDAARVVALRSAAMRSIAGQGGMASVSLPLVDLERRLAPFEGRLSMAAINGPADLVVSGEPEALEELLEACEGEGIRARRIAVDYAAHSAQIDALREELLEAFGPIEPSLAQIPFHSTVVGDLLDTTGLDADYWYRNLRETVRLEPVITLLLEQGRRSFIEIGPHPVLSFGIDATAEAAGVKDAAVLGTLRHDDDGPERFTLSLAAAEVSGVEVDWAALTPGASRVPLPTYPFQHERFWLMPSAGAGDVTAAGLTDPDHPLLGAMADLPDGGLLLSGRISLAAHPWLADHAVAGTVLLPGTAFVELALGAGRQVGAETVAELTIVAPLVLPGEGAVALQVSVTRPGEDGRRSLSIRSRDESEEAEWVEHAACALTDRPSVVPESLVGWPPVGAEPLDTEDLYDRLTDVGLEYGPAFAGLRRAWRGRDGEIFAEVALAEDQHEAARSFAIHPALLDAALHASALAGTDEEEGRQLRLPFAWAGVRTEARGATELRVTITARAEGEISLLAHDGSGAPLARVDSLATRPLDPARLGADTATVPLLGLELVSVALPEVAVPEVDHAICDTRDWELPDDPVGAAHLVAARALDRIQDFLADADAASRLVFLTEGALGPDPDPALATLVGLRRAAAAEHPGRLALIDLDHASEEELERALSSSAAEPEVVLREGRALVPRLGKGLPEILVPPPDSWRLEATRRGTLESLALVPAPHATGPLGPGEVRIGMRAAGLNFRDLMIALGLNREQAPIGSEGAGIVVEVGPDVDDLAPGDRVFGFVPEAFAPLARADRSSLAVIPDGWSFEQAAAIPVAFLTAAYGLHDLADLRAGERVLIHAGAGGVGMAAIQLANERGAEVYATASASKWEVLEGLGIPSSRIASSRDLDFRESFLDATGGEGVDVVLNSLAGDFVDASLDLLPRGGRFLEMGKTDIRDAARIAESHPGVAYRAFDFSEVGPVRIGDLFAEVLGHFADGRVQHGPINVRDAREAPAAFRHLREGLNVGKLVLRIPPPLDPERTVLLTGGTGALGAIVARHLVEAHDARHLLLASRSGPEAEGAEALRSELEALGAEVDLAACDVGDREELTALIGSIDPDHPLGAVIHAAGVLDDGVVEALDPDRIDRVMGPKADAAWHLHELTADLDLTHFVLFSSVAGTLGSPGQANYAAANAFLDALAARRRAEGLPATSIAWGAWVQGSGLTEGLGEADLARMRRSGIRNLSDEAGLGLFDAALRAGAPFALAAALDRPALRAAAGAGALPPVLSGLVRSTGRGHPTATGSLAARLAALPDAEREESVLATVTAEVAAVLGQASAAAIEPDRAFKDLGFDSLAAVELRNRLGAATGLALPATIVFDHPSARGLCKELLIRATTGLGANQKSWDVEFDRFRSLVMENGISQSDRNLAAARLRSLAVDIEAGFKDSPSRAGHVQLESASADELLSVLDALAPTDDITVRNASGRAPS